MRIPPVRKASPRRPRLRTLTASFFMSLDGVVDAPHEWHFPYMDDEANAASSAVVDEADTILLGRTTYEEWVRFWPAQGTSSPMAAFFNTTPKLVASTTLEELEWDGAALISDDVAGAVRVAKDGPGKDIAIFGSGTLVSALLLEGLVDELRTMVHPIVVGRGKRLFEGGGDKLGLRLVGRREFPSGVVSLTYTSTG
jgi:dihydrofolate reductase